MANTTNFGWETPDDTDLVKDGAAAMRTLGNSIDASFVDLKGGTTGQVLAKASNTDLDFTWATDASGIPATIFDAKGDLIAATAADTAARLAVGTNGQVLTADSAQATGLKWATPAGGKVLQVVQGTTTTSTTIVSTSWTSTSLTASITPSATTSKILILTSQPCLVSRSSNQMGGGIRLVRGSTHIFGDNTSSAPNRNFYWTFVGVTDMQVQTQFNLSYLDSPSTTSSTTYTVEGAYNSAGAMTFQNSSQTGSIILMEIGA